jgi:hypothetical protein
VIWPGQCSAAFDNSEAAVFSIAVYPAPNDSDTVATMTISDSASEAASADEAKFFHAIARKWTPFSQEIKRVTFRFGEDSDGFPAVWIVVVVPADLKPSKEKIDNLYRATEHFRSDIRNSGTSRWPYVTIETE